MVYSMTGFGRAINENDDYDITVEIKTVNHKFLDIQINSPYYFNFLDEEIKKIVKKYINRGRVEIYIKSVKKIGNNVNINIDYEFTNIVANSLRKINEYLNIKEDISLNNILKYDGIINLEYEKKDEVKTREFIIQIISESLIELKEMREKEGDNLILDINNKLYEVENIVMEIRDKAPEVTEKYRLDLFNRVNDIFVGSENLDEDRINLEIALYAEKSDITEELVRLSSHIELFKKTIDGITPIGRKLDFIVQEMNREINTIGSKSNSFEINKKVIELKTIVEKIREQLQNIE